MCNKPNRSFCLGCNADITLLHVQCAECDNVELCMQCFACGVEVKRHLKSHKYLIKDYGTFSLFNPTWTAEEEQILLDSVEQYGLGNWDEVAANIATKNAREVEEHYIVAYIDGYFGKLTVPADIPNRMTDHTPPIHESIFSTPLPAVNVSKQELIELAYMPNRDEFEYEYDNEAEGVISSLFMNHEDNDLEKGLKLAKVDMYHSRLKERQRRKDIAREYKLVEQFCKKMETRHFGKYEKEMRSSFQCFSQFMKYDQFEKMVDDLRKERLLKQKINKLKNYRRNGLVRFEACASFDTAFYKREKRKRVSSSGRIETPVEKALPGNTSDTLAKFSDLKQQSGYNLLATSEKLLCRGMKLLPTKYLTAKVLIMKDAMLKHSGQNKPRYSLAVEKFYRRRINNFLQQNGWIS